MHAALMKVNEMRARERENEIKRERERKCRYLYEVYRSHEKNTRADTLACKLTFRTQAEPMVTCVKRARLLPSNAATPPSANDEDA